MSIQTCTTVKRTLPVLAMVAMCTATSALGAGRESIPANSLRLQGSGSSQGGIAGAQYPQNFETFNLGPGCGQQGWTGFCGAGPPPVGFQIVDFSGTEPSFGTRTVRHISDGSGFAGFEVTGAIQAAVDSVMGADIIITNNTTLYQMVVVNSIAAFFNTRINFELNGNITALQIDPNSSPPCTTGLFAATTGTWTPNVKMRITVEVIGDATNTMRIYKDGALIFTGVDIAGGCGPAAAPKGMNQFRNWAQNLASAGVGPAMLIDNISEALAGATCLGDIAPAGGNGQVNIDDLFGVINTWGPCPAPCPPSCTADIAPAGGNCQVNIDDLFAVINAWGPCPGPPPPMGACCLSNGMCLVNQTPGQCTAAGGTYQGTNAPCPPAGCPVLTNNTCEGATTLTLPGSHSDTLVGATTTGNPPGMCSGVTPGLSRWHKVTGNGSLITATTCTSPQQLWDARLSVYCGATCASLSCVSAVNGDTCNFFHETITWCSAPGQVYYILVHTPTNPAPEGNYTLTVSSGAPCANPPSCAPAGIAGDQCSGPISIGSGPVGPIAWNNTGATSTPADPNTCDQFGDSPTIYKDLWFLWTATSTGSVTVTTCGTTFDNKMAMYTFGPCPRMMSDMIGCNDDFTGCAPNPQFDAAVTSGSQYLIRIGSWGPTQADGPGTLSITAGGGGGPPPNDECTAPQNIGSGNVGPIAWSSAGATSNAGNGDTCNQFGDSPTIYQDIWFSWTATSTGTVTVSGCGAAAFDWKMAMYSGGCPTSMGNMIGCNDDTCGTEPSFTAPVTAAQQYLIRVGSWSPTSATGSASITISGQ